MATIRFTPILSRFFPELDNRTLATGTVADLLMQLEGEFPGLSAYLLDDQGALRQHVNIFVDGEKIRDLSTLSDQVGKGQEVFVMQALSGG